MRELGASCTSTSSSQQDANDSLRRTNLYGLSSKKRLPRVHIAPQDARVRKDLQLLDCHNLYENGVDSVQQQRFEVGEELQDRKHRENEGLRPPLDRIQSLQDLTTTVPKDLRLAYQHDSMNKKKMLLHQREWRVGYANNLHAALFEPTDSMREHIAFRSQEDQMMTENGSVVVAYPLQTRTAAAIDAELQPYDEEAACEAMERKMCIRKSSNQIGSDADDASIPWCPASYSTLHDYSEEIQRTMGPRKKGTKIKPGSLAADLKQSQPFPVRDVCADPEISARSRKTPLSTDAKCVAKKQNVVARAVECYTRVRQRIDRQKNSGLRYSLPVEDLSQTRTYRAGLDPVPSTFEARTSSTIKEDSENNLLPSMSPPAASRIRFRPRSAAGHVPFRSCSGANLHITTAVSNGSSCLEPAPSVGKVAGAKRRPTSASVCYLGSSTIYCMDVRATSSSTLANSRAIASVTAVGDGCNGTNFTGALDKERLKRQQNQAQMLQMLSQRGMFHNLPVPQIFARLRRESLKNLTRRLQYAKYEKVTMEEYMTSCGMQTIVKQKNGPKHSSVDAEITFDVDPQAPCADAVRCAVSSTVTGEEPPANTIAFATASVPNGSTSTSVLSSLLEMRKALFVTRQQFHIALEAFNLAPTDVNLLFSALDVAVSDNVRLWEILCAAEKLQDGHAELRRSRVHVKARDLPKDLDVLRKSVSIPNLMHTLLATPTSPGLNDIDENTGVDLTQS